MLDAIAAGLDERNPGIAMMIRSSHTRATPVAAEALGPWQVVDVTHNGTAHPQRWFVGHEPTTGETCVLSGHPEHWARVTEGAQVRDAAQAAELAGVHSDATRDMGRGYAPLGSVDDIRWLPHPTDAQRERISALTAGVGEDIAVPTATGDGPWEVRLWTVTDGDLVRHDVVVGTDGSVSDRPVVVEADLPVPQAR